ERPHPHRPQRGHPAAAGRRGLAAAGRRDRRSHDLQPDRHRLLGRADLLPLPPVHGAARHAHGLGGPPAGAPLRVHRGDDVRHRGHDAHVRARQRRRPALVRPDRRRGVGHLHRVPRFALVL
ncbi:MAG: hypothetical protein AVDCRST_MAG38-1454, partial [uncultured Solirubrobacteraceae bacterium]